jgi:hypothetical protein
MRFGIAVLSTWLALASCKASEEVPVPQKPDIATEIQTAFAAVRTGDAGLVGALARHGDAIVPAVSLLVTDSNATVRREAVAVLGAVDTSLAATAALPALADVSPDVAERAARVVLQATLRNGPDVIPGLQAAMAAAAKNPVPGAAQLLLAGFNTGDTQMLEATLAQNAQASGPRARLVKLADSDAAVDAALPAALALSRRGHPAARQQLTDRLAGKPSPATLEFMLKVISMIDAPALLQALAGQSLGNQQEIADGLPAGIAPRRRICDLAVEAFTARLGLHTGIVLNPSSRYSRTDIETVRKAVLSATPQ